MKTYKIFIVTLVAVFLVTLALEVSARAESAKHYLDRGIEAGKKGQYDQAFADFNKALELNPRYSLAYYNRAVAYAKKGQDDRAIADFSKALELDPRNAQAYYNRAVAFYYKKKYDQAWEDVRKAQCLGYKVKPVFLDDLRRASGRER